MFGDYEAQRHWQEITVNLPITDWYRNTTDNNLLYWGLDYPPLTALHSQAMGHVAHTLNGSWVQLHGSRGEESYEHKIFMRVTVLVSELLHLTPLFLLLSPSTCSLSALFLLAITPSQPLIDHGHFQYNSISLGLTLLAVLALKHGWVCTGSATFSLALNYKQMSLYHALPFFFYILGPRYNSWSGVKELVKVGLTVVLTFALCWLPFVDTAGDVLTRMFPFNRGLFEDKVANFWCSISVIVKVRELLSRITLVRAALFFTLVSVLPSQLLLFRESTPHKFILALTNSALGFFLFSFHVHEKTILIPLTTVVLLYNDKRTNGQTNGQTNELEVSLPVVWFTIIATFSMWPLLLKDGLYMMYIAGMGLYLTTVYILFKQHLYSKTVLLFILSVLGCAILHILEMYVEPPERYPHIYPTLTSLYSAGHFALFFCYFNYRQIVD